jgi:hypothetical protein
MFRQTVEILGKLGGMSLQSDTVTSGSTKVGYQGILKGKS